MPDNTAPNVKRKAKPIPCRFRLDLEAKLREQSQATNTPMITIIEQGLELRFRKGFKRLLKA